MINYNLLKYKFYSTVVSDILRAIEGGSYGGAFILSFCCIDYFSVPLALEQGKQKSDKNDFKLFIQKYLNETNKKYSNLHDELYAIRCSLVHSYGESDATKQIELTPHLLYGDDITDLHLTLENKKVLYINLSDFVSEIITAIEIYFYLNSTSTTLNEWSPKLYYPQNNIAVYDRNMIKNGGAVNYKSIHPMLEILESNETFDIVRSTLKSIIEKEININLKKGTPTSIVQSGMPANGGKLLK